MAEVGVKDVAALAGVSLGTVSNVLNRPDAVRPDTRAKVEQAIAQLGDLRNESARQLRAKSSRLIAYVLLDVGNPFFTDVARAASDAAHEAELSLILCSTDGDAEREDEYLGLLLEQRVRGVLVTPTSTHSPRLKALTAAGIPVVVVDRLSDDKAVGCSVGVDDVEGGALAVRHLIEQGHRRIAFVGRPHGVPQIVDRHHGALAALREAGRPESDLVVIDAPNPNLESGRLAAETLANMPRRGRPTAAFCANDLLALGLQQSLLLKGWSLPRDLAIVGYDDIELAANAVVPLTSIRQPRSEMGRSAVELLLAEPAGRRRHRHTAKRFRPELVVRASS